jgi:hypothetical protein
MRASIQRTCYRRADDGRGGACDRSVESEVSRMFAATTTRKYAWLSRKARVRLDARRRQPVLVLLVAGIATVHNHVGRWEPPGAQDARVQEGAARWAWYQVVHLLLACLLLYVRQRIKAFCSPTFANGLAGCGAVGVWGQRLQAQGASTLPAVAF